MLQKVDMFKKNTLLTALLLMTPLFSRAGISMPAPTLPLAATLVQTETVPPVSNQVDKDVSSDDIKEIWTASLPENAQTSCMASICLGDDVNSLPKQSLNEFGEHVDGIWHQGARIIPNEDLANLSRELDDDLVSRMTNIEQVCSLAKLPKRLKPRIALSFNPNEGELGAIDVVAQVLPKKEKQKDASTYAITQIKMHIRVANPEISLQWAQQVQELWPGMKSQIVAANDILPEHIAMWSSRDMDGKPVIGESMVQYSVEPVLAVNDDNFNIKQWQNRQITHTLQWLPGVTNLDAELRRQPGCVNAKNKIF